MLCLHSVIVMGSVLVGIWTSPGFEGSAQVIEWHFEYGNIFRVEISCDYKLVDPIAT